ncbi:unnamed protein product [Medioppia subpectinata]|uniref:NR LBD domain-containing protein n=1 Tax=Medioppia subpectinata TaxID=1979941 RepID=A0A7R9L0Z1_9ACAR|nr:unnamed protein product [Medioppia subpectinata]CAG2113163.1 unnamed protein product [Medioppia subpectinata]
MTFYWLCARNFGAMTCNSCKAFFRRTGLKNQLICASNGKCDINVMTRNTENNVTDITLNETLVVTTDIKEKPENTAIVPMFREITDYNGLNELENKRIRELTSAALMLNYNISDNILPANSLDEMIQTCGSRQEDGVLTMVNFAKSLSGFSTICRDDRVALMKYGYNDLLTIRTIKLYDKSAENFYIPLLTAIAFYNPNRPNLIHKYSVK